MSPGWDPTWSLPLGFPRVSGDEPSKPARLATATTFSPRERG